MFRRCGVAPVDFSALPEGGKQEGSALGVTGRQNIIDQKIGTYLEEFQKD